MTLDPILGQSRPEIEKFRKEAVEEYLANKSSFNKSDLRHYRQLEVSFDPRRIKELLRKLQISTEVTALVFGGYTGQFANALQNLGMRVIFTDPLEQWVTKARRSGLEAHRYSAQEIPSDLLDRTQLVTTFECYYPLISSKIYNTLRFLTRDDGLLFAESEPTRREMQTESASGGMKFSFLPFYKVYSVVRVFREEGDLRFYHCYAPNLESREMMLSDAKVMKAVHDHLPTDSTLTLESLLSIPSISAIGKDSLDQSLNRIMEVHYHDLPQWWKSELWSCGIWIGTKSFRLEKSRLAMLDA